MDLTTTDKTLIAEAWTCRDLYSNLETLCDFGSRFAGTPSEIQARDFIAEKFRAYGLTDVRLDPFEYLGWWRGKSALQVVAPTPRATTRSRSSTRRQLRQEDCVRPSLMWEWGRRKNTRAKKIR